MLEAALKTFALNLDFARRLVEDLDGAELCAQPAGHPTHGAWTLGHLAYSCQAVGEEIGLTHWFDEPTAALFRPGSKPTADASRYPAKADLLKLLADGAARVEAAITALGPAGMAKPLPDVRFRKTLPTVGHAVVYSCCGHAALHAGLLVAWRRAAGHRAVSAYFPGPRPAAAANTDGP